MFDWYTGFDDHIADGIAEACYWIGYKKTLNSVGLDDEVLNEGMELLRIFVNHRASLYRHRDELKALATDKAKAMGANDQAKLDALEKREMKIKEKAVIVVWKILEQREPFDDWMAMEGIAERPR